MVENALSSDRDLKTMRSRSKAGQEAGASFTHASRAGLAPQRQRRSGPNHLSDLNTRDVPD